MARKTARELPNKLLSASMAAVLAASLGGMPAYAADASGEQAGARATAAADSPATSEAKDLAEDVTATDGVSLPSGVEPGEAHAGVQDALVSGSPSAEPGDASAKEGSAPEPPAQHNGASSENAADDALPAADDALPAADDAAGTVQVGTAADLPAQISADTTVELTADITLASGQQIANIAGTLDGRGHTVTLADTPLAAEIQGTVQNLGVKSSGTIASDSNLGSVAVLLSEGGMLQNCWSTASLKLDGWNGEVGGLVGELAGGTVRNSYFAGSIDAMMSGGIVGTGASGTVANNVFTVGDGPVSMGYGSLVKQNNEKKTADELKSADVLGILSAEAPDTGFTWACQGEYPQLVSADAPAVVNKDALAAAIDAASALDEASYTPETWQPFAAALSAARDVLANDDATQQQVNDATAALTTAQQNLQKPKPSQPVDVPSSATHLASQDDVAGIDVANADACYVLDADIAITDPMVALSLASAPLAGTLDGQGHTITFDRAAGAKQLFAGVAATGVVQNVSFAGELVYESGNKLASGPLGTTLAGAVINCATSVTGDNIVGLARTLDGGAVSNVLSVANGGKVGGVLFAGYQAGTLTNVYWQQYLANPVAFPAHALVNSYALAPEDMRTQAFVDLLNTNRGQNGTQWNQGVDGLPYFGPAQDYVPPKDTTPDDVYPVTFTDNSGASHATVNHVLEVSPDDVAADRQIGTLTLSGVPEGSSITWATDDANKGNIGVNEATGQLYVYNNATGTVTATEHAADGSTRTVATVVVQAKSQPIDDFQLWYDGQNVTGGAITVQGSQVRNLEVRVHYVGAPAGEYVPASFTRFAFTGSDPSIIYSNDYSACFYFKKQGSATVSVTSRTNPDLPAKQVTVTSEHVAATSISMGYAEDGQPIMLHGRNPLAAGSQAFLTSKARPQVTPDNATNRDNFTVTSSNPQVAAYTTSGDIGYTPYAAGTTTFTATLPDHDPATGAPLSAQTTVTYQYENPLVSVTAPHRTMTVAGGSHTPLDLTFIGARDAEGYSVTEPGMTWTYSTDGVVSIDRDVTGAWKHEAGAPDDGLFLASDAYTLTALTPGTVTVTGTPVDQTAGAQPLTFTVTVDGIAPSPDMDKLVSAGIDSATRYLDSQRSAEGFQYGDEWEVYTFLKAGRTIDPAMLDAYYASVTAAKSSWQNSATDMERVGLALAAMGKDVTDVDGVNVVDAVCTSSQLQGRANAQAFALLLLDAAQATPAADAAWTRDALVDALVAAVGEHGASIAKGTDGDVDVTAMVLQALAPYADRSDVAAAIDRGLSFLRGAMNAGMCDFGSSESDAQVLLALVALNKNPLSADNGFANATANVITALASYNVDPGFSHLKGGAANATSSVQALQALTAYQRATGENVDWGTNGSTVKPGTTVDNPKDSPTPAEPKGQAAAAKNALLGASSPKAATAAGKSLAKTGDSAGAAVAATALACLAAAAVVGGAARRRAARRQ